MAGASAITAERACRAQGRNTVQRLLAAGLAEFAARGYQAVTVDDIVRAASASHGTLYLYFASKDDFFRALAKNALRDMEGIAGDFPVVTSNADGRAALQEWVDAFCDTYAAHATVLRILSQVDLVGRDIWARVLGALSHVMDAIVVGMTAGTGDGGMNVLRRHLDALACLMMLERVKYLLSIGVTLPRTEMVDRLAAITYAAFHPDG